MAKLSIAISDELLEKINARGNSRSRVIQRDLDRYYGLLERALKRAKLSVKEACLIADVLNGTVIDARTAGMFWAEVEDGIELEGYDEKWGVDGQALVEKLKNLNELQAMAIIDAAERFWTNCESGKETEGESLEEKIARFFCIRD